MAFTKKEKIHSIIHTAAATAAGIGGGLAQIPTSDIVLITPVQVGMIVAIALVHGRKVNEATATAILGTGTAGLFGRALSQALIGWIPGFGNAVNACTAAALTEAIGWSAHKFFEDLGNEPMDEDEIRRRMKNARPALPRSPDYVNEGYRDD